jgi:glycosyltransferase involved in cell wall biosynthesis
MKKRGKNKMKKYPLVSICIPNYNYGCYLESCLDSVLNQTYPNLEVLFRDNDSTDDSYDIAVKYKKKFDEKGIYFNISYNKRNLGSDRNSQILRSGVEGEFFYHLASDDAIEPEFVSKVIDVFERYPNVCTVITHRKEIDENGLVHETPPFYNQNCIIKGEDQAAVYMMAGIAIPGQRMFRNSAMGPIGGYQRIFNVAGDWYSNFLAAMVGDVAYIKDPLCRYRVHTGNETSESELNLTGIFEHYQLINSFRTISLDFGMKKPAARYEEAVEKLGSMCLRYALKMLQNNLNHVALRYLQLAPVLKRDIIEDATYKKLLKCLNMSGRELDMGLREILDESPLSRTQSYNPPEGFMPLNIA